MVFEQPLIVVIFELRTQPQMVHPPGRCLRPVEMNLLFLVRKVVGIAEQFERRAAAYRQRVIEISLTGKDECLPGEGTARTAVNAPRRLVEPTRADIVAEQLARIAVSLQPRRV